MFFLNVCEWNSADLQSGNSQKIVGCQVALKIAARGCAGMSRGLRGIPSDPWSSFNDPKLRKQSIDSISFALNHP